MIKIKIHVEGLCGCIAEQVALIWKILKDHEYDVEIQNFPDHMDKDHPENSLPTRTMSENIKHAENVKINISTKELPWGG